MQYACNCYTFYIKPLSYSKNSYCIMQIIHGGKLSRFSQIYFQSQKFSSENFLSYCKVFLGLKMADSGPGSGPGLLRYFKLCREDSCQILLPNPTRLLCEKLDSATIEEANKEVTAVIVDTGGKRKPYLNLTYEKQAATGRYAAEHGTVNAIRCFARDFPKDSLKESTICGWKKAYLQEL